MVICKRDVPILRSKEVRELKEQYREKFGEGCPVFCYEDFPSTKDKIASQRYLEALRNAVKADKPWKIESFQDKEFPR